MDGGHCNGSSLDFAMRRGELLDRPKTAAAEFACHSVSPRSIRVDHSNQPYRCALFRELMVYASVVAAEGAHADHGDVNKITGCQFSVLSWLVARRLVDLITKDRIVTDETVLIQEPAFFSNAIWPA